MRRRHRFLAAVTIAAVAAVAGTVPSNVPAAIAAPGEGFTPAAGRLLDTRDPSAGATTIDGQHLGQGRLDAGSVMVVRAADRAGVPADARSVALTVTITDPLTAGFVTVHPCGPVPGVSTVNFARGQTVANSIVAMLDPDGRFCVYTMAPTHVIVDVTGTLGDALAAVTPGRLFDSRPGFGTTDGESAGEGVRSASSITEVQVSGRSGIPVGALAAALTVTVTGPAADGHVGLYPCGPRPLASTVNHRRGATISNSSIVPLDATGKVCVFTLVSAHVVIDVTGYVPVGSAYAPLTPSRVMDTRFDGVSVDHVCEATGRVASGTAASVPVVGRAGVPAAGVGAVVLNVTTLGAKRPGFVTAFVPDTAVPVASTVNFVPDDLISNSVIAPVDADGRVALFVNTGAHLVVDVVGWLPGTSTATPGASCTGTFVDPRQDRQFVVNTSGRSGCALLNDRDVQCWYTTMFVLRFHQEVQQPFTGELLEIGGANGAMCALRRDGTVQCLQGHPVVSPVEIPFPTPIVDIAGFGMSAGFCAIDDAARLWCWTPSITPDVAGPSIVETSGPAAGFVGAPVGQSSLAVRTSAGTADVIVNQPDGRFSIVSTSSAVGGHPWSAVVSARRDDVSGQMCLVLIDGRATCGSSGDLAPDMDVASHGEGIIRDPKGAVIWVRYDEETARFSPEPVAPAAMIRPVRLEDCYHFGVPRFDGWCSPAVSG